MFSDPAIWTLVPAKDAFGIIQTQAGIAALQERVAQEIGSDVWLFGGQNSPSSVWKNSVLATDKLGSMATTVAFVKDGIYAIGTQSSFFYLYNEITATLYPIVIDGPTDSYVTNCAIDKGGVLWYVTNDLSGGIGQFNGKNWTTLNDQTSPGLGFLSMGPITALNTITVTSRNDIWLSTFAYGSKFFNRETGVWSSYEDSASLTKTLPSPIARFDAPTNSYWSMISGTCEDSSGYIWLANQKAYNGNIIHIRNPHDPAEWRSISLNDPSYAASFPSEYTGPIAAGYNKKLNTNNIYLGFTSKENLTGGGFVILSYPAGKNPLTATITSSTRLLDNISITGIAVANDSVVWISNDNGIYKLLNNGTLTVAKVNKIISNSGFFAVAIGNNQMPIFAKDRDLYTYIDNSDSLVNITQNGLLAKDIGGITYDSKNGVYWIASKNGIFRYDSGDSTRSIASSSTIDVYPNPMSQKSFKNGHVLHFSGLDIGNPSTIRIFDANGAFVTSISEKNTKLINWNGTNLLGKIITPGVYYYLANAENQSKCRGKIFVTP